MADQLQSGLVACAVCYTAKRPFLNAVRCFHCLSMVAASHH